MSYSTLFFDLDDTLYPPTSGIWEAVGQRMEKYMVETLSIPADIVCTERDRLFHTHGTTFRGLVAEYGIDDISFLDYVHDIPINQYLSFNPRLFEVISRLDHRKIIFTNANASHASRVLKALGLEGLFDQVIDILSIKPWCKPQKEAFSTALQLAQIDNPSTCIMIDDAYRNLITAHELGMFTIQIGTQIALPSVDLAFSSLEDFPETINFNQVLELND